MSEQNNTLEELTDFTLHNFAGDPLRYIDETDDADTRDAIESVCDDHVTMRRMLQLLVIACDVPLEKIEKAHELAEALE